MSERRFIERDPYAPIQYGYQVDQVLCSGRSDFQEYQVITNPFFGRIMILDGVVQLTERDEFFYHEMLAHVPLHSRQQPENVIVIGGGDGGAVREVVRHDCVKNVWLVDIDPEVTRLSKEYFPGVACGLSDPRVRVLHEDGAAFLRNFDGRADLVLVDSTDIVGMAKVLFSPQFFGDVNRVLTDDGLFVTLSESLHFHFPIVRDVQNTMRDVFGHADLYTAPIATYGGNWWCFAVGHKGRGCRAKVRPTVAGTRYYCDEIHSGCFLPDFLYSRLMDPSRDRF